MEYPINQNKGRYTIGSSDWEVSSVGDSPNGNQTGEIKPLKFTKGKVDTDILKPVLDVDGIVVQAGEYMLVSKKTLSDIKEWNNPHWDFLPNGVVMVKDKGVTLGKSIPILKISIDKFSTIGDERDIANLNAGVKEAEYIYEGEKTDDVPNNLIEQINYTLNEGTQRPGDTFSIYDLQLGSDSVYSVTELVISSLQEDGKFDKGKLTSFISEVDKRLAILNKDFNGIKDTFYNGVPPISKGVKLFTNQIADSNSDTTFEGSTYLSETSKVVTVEPTPNDKGIDAQKRATDDLAKKAAEALKVETDSLRTTQRTLSERVADAGGVTDYVRQKGGWDKFVKELREQPKETK
jgi:hypothetical protein